jgi:hypothetical protein
MPRGPLRRKASRDEAHLQLWARPAYTCPSAFGEPSLFMSTALGIGEALNQE